MQLSPKAEKLHELLNGCNLSKKVETVRKFLSSLEPQEVLETVNSRWNEGWTPLMKVCDYSASLPIAELIINSVTDKNEREKLVNAKNEHGQTPLLIAISFEKWNIARLLIENGADIHVTNFMGQTPFMVACEDGKTDMVLYFLEKRLISLSEAKKIIDERHRVEGNKKKKFFNAVYEYINQEVSCKIGSTWRGYKERKRLYNPTNTNGRIKTIYEAYKDGMIPRDGLNVNTKAYVERLESNVYNVDKTPTINAQQGGSEYKIYNGKRYIVKNGPKGGHYIIAKGVKVYVSK